MKTGLYGRDMPGSLDAVNGGCIPARLPGFSSVQGRLAREAAHPTRMGDAVRSRRGGGRVQRGRGYSRGCAASHSRARRWASASWSTVNLVLATSRLRTPHNPIEEGVAEEG